MKLSQHYTENSTALYIMKQQNYGALIRHVKTTMEGIVIKTFDNNVIKTNFIKV